MNEDEEGFEPLIEENAGGGPEAWPSPKTDATLLRGCPHRKHTRGHWSFWAEGFGWQFSLVAPRGLWRRGVAVAGAEHVLCLDDAVLFALGYEQGLRDMAAERKENLS